LQRQGIQAAKKNGKYLGRKTVINKKLISQVQNLKENKNLSITEIVKVTGRGRTTIYKVLKEKLNYIPYNRLVKQARTNDLGFVKQGIEDDKIDTTSQYIKNLSDDERRERMKSVDTKNLN
jgi:hypothetical protein